MTTTTEPQAATRPGPDLWPSDAPEQPTPPLPQPARTTSAVALRPDPVRALQAKTRYAQALADSGLLPPHYRRQPANVLFAVEYGDMLGIPAMAAIIGIHVIEGKPTASAGLISALVRKAGHKLRVGYDAATMTGWAEIVRADDPGYTFRSEWDLDRAVTAELCTIRDGKPFALDSKGRSLPWRKFYPSMTKHRAVTEVARDACEEALYGLHYTPEELGAEVAEDGTVLGVLVPDQLSRQAVHADDPDADPWSVRTDEGVKWMAGATARAAGAPDLAALQKLWAETGKQLSEGAITKEDADHVADLMRARNEVLVAAEAEITDATIVDDLEPDDPWAAKVADIATAEEAERVLAELDEVARASDMPLAVHDRIKTAVEARLAFISANPGGDSAPAGQEPARLSTPAEAFISAWRARLDKAAEQDLAGLQRDIGSAVARKTLTTQQGDLLSDAIRDRRKTLSGEQAAL